MTIEISASLKEEMLQELIGLTPGGPTKNHVLMVSYQNGPGVDGVFVDFVVSRSQHTASLTTENVTLPIPAGTTVQSIYISEMGVPGAPELQIELEGSEIHEYTQNGTYTINNLRITF